MWFFGRSDPYLWRPGFGPRITDDRPECHENGPEPYENYMGRTKFGWNPRICGFYGEPRPIRGSKWDIGAPTVQNFD